MPGERWSLQVVRDVFNGLRRFEELRDHLGVARNVLSGRLSNLVDAGLLERVAYRENACRTGSSGRGSGTSTR